MKKHPILLRVTYLFVLAIGWMLCSPTDANAQQVVYYPPTVIAPPPILVSGPPIVYHHPVVPPPPIIAQSPIISYSVPSPVYVAPPPVMAETTWRWGPILGWRARSRLVQVPQWAPAPIVIGGSVPPPTFPPVYSYVP